MSRQVYISGILSLIALIHSIFGPNTAIAASQNRDQTLLQQCWPEEQLKARTSEKYVRRRVKGAILPSPDVAYSKPPSIPSSLRGSIRRVQLPKGHKLVALTFDFCEAHGEVAGYDGRIIDYLRQHNIKATLFVGGKWLLSHQERAQQLIADPLFEIGNHGWTHKNFRNITSNRMLSELINTQKAYRITQTNLQNRACVKQSARKLNKPDNITLFRFPYGACRKNSLKMVGDQGLLAVQWDVSTADPVRSQTAPRIARSVLRQTQPGSIIIAHANGRGWHTAKALPLFIPKLIEKGYKFVTVSELLQAGKPVISNVCYDFRIGDVNRYDLRRKKRSYTSS